MYHAKRNEACSMSLPQRWILRLLLPPALALSFTALLQAGAHHPLPGQGEILCRPLSLITREEYLAQEPYPPLPPLQDGDILLTFSTHSFGWRHGHAGLVVDGQDGRVLEAVVLGRPSAVCSAEHWRAYSTLLVLRPASVPAELPGQVAQYALEHLDAIPYHLTSGLGREKAPGLETGIGAQCAYLVWYAYFQFGYDLDGDGGRLVTVRDLASSPLLQVIYCRGISPSICKAALPAA